MEGNPSMDLYDGPSQGLEVPASNVESGLCGPWQEAHLILQGTGQSHKSVGLPLGQGDSNVGLQDPSGDPPLLLLAGKKLQRDKRAAV
jgi:hypothetical protein